MKALMAALALVALPAPRPPCVADGINPWAGQPPCQSALSIDP